MAAAAQQNKPPGSQHQQPERPGQLPPWMLDLVFRAVVLGELALADRKARAQSLGQAIEV